MKEFVFMRLISNGISLMENILIVNFCLAFMKKKMENSKDYISYAGVILVGFLFSLVENAPMLYGWEAIITVSILTVYLYFFTEGSFLKKTAVALLARGMVSIVNSIVLFLSSLMLGESIATLIQENDLVWVLLAVLSKLLYFFMGKILVSVLFKKNELQRWQWAVIGSSVFFSMLAGTSLISMARSMPEYQMQAQKWILLAAASIWLMCLVTYFIVQRMIQDNQEKMEYQLMLQEEKFRRESLEQLKNGNEELREFKHDLKNCLLPIRQKIQNQNMEGAGAIWEEICRKIDGIQILVQTGNEYIDVVLNEKMSLARREQIDVKCFIVSRIEKIDVLAFCSILGNLMDNAIEAERKIKEVNKRIEVEMNIKYGFLHLKVKNRIEDSILEENPELATTKEKKEEHGIGHKSIERTVKKLSGKVKYYEKNDLFCAEVVFPVEVANKR